MNEVLELLTGNPDVVVRELTEADDDVYFESYKASLPEIELFDPQASAKHRTREHTQQARLNAGNKIRMGIWDGETFVGSVNATPDDDGNIEIGYWTDSRHTGKGYASLGARALSAHIVTEIKPPKVYAVIDAQNQASDRVLEKSGFRWVYKDTKQQAIFFELQRAAVLNVVSNVGQYYDALDTAYDYDASTAQDEWSVNQLLDSAISPDEQATSIRSVLDIGAGTGQTIEKILHIANPETVTGVDPSAGMLSRLNSKFSDDPRINVTNTTIQEYLRTNDDTHDLITIMGTAEFIDDLPGVLSSLGQRLNSGGTLALTFIPQTRPGLTEQTFPLPGTDVGFTEHYWSPTALESALQKVGLTTELRETTEAYTRGSGALTESVVYSFLVARKLRS